MPCGSGAGVMSGMMLAAGETGNIFSRRNALILTAAGMILFDPTIIAQAGFLFSFASLAGILCLDAPLRNFLRLGEESGFLEWKAAIVLKLGVITSFDTARERGFWIIFPDGGCGKHFNFSRHPAAFFAGLALAVASFLSPFFIFLDCSACPSDPFSYAFDHPFFCGAYHASAIPIFRSATLHLLLWPARLVRVRVSRYEK